MPTQAWPYAVARGEISGYQAIVVPSFLADAGLAYVLEYASRREACEPDAAIMREVLGATSGPLSLVYRIVVARAARYQLGGEDLLYDRAGRPICVFEGLVFRLPAEQVASLGLIANDLDAVTGMTVSTFRRLLVAPERIDPERSTAISVGNILPGIRPLNVQISEPYVVPGSSKKREKYESPPQAAKKTVGVSWLVPVILGILVALLLVLILK